MEEKKNYNWMSNKELLSLVENGEHNEELTRVLAERLKRDTMPASDESSARFAARQLENHFNNMSFKYDDFIEYLLNSTHRYLQNEIFKTFIKAMVRLGKLENCYYDGRNEYSQKCSEIIAKALEEKNMI